MTILDLKKHYSRFLLGHEGLLHFSAHSHHFWPDVTREAQLRYWDDSATLSDKKWEKIFSDVIPRAQTHIAKILNLKHSDQIVFAPNTHELGARILSLFLGKPKLKVLTTSSEFHSWRRQLHRLMELKEVETEFISTKNFNLNRKEFLNSLITNLNKKPDVFFISQVFFDSGLALTDDELHELAQACTEETIMVVDGYHAFAAIPTQLKNLENRIFYLSGGYKYAQGGEGVCFMVVPPGNWRPAYTGWFAEFAHLTQKPNQGVGYGKNAQAFWGSTFDASGLYRLNATWDLWDELNISIKSIHSHVLSLQKHFIANIPSDFLNSYRLTPLFDRGLAWHGHFLTFEAFDQELALTAEQDLREVNILIDRRGNKLRFGFGLYQNLLDIEALVEKLKDLKKS